MIENLRLLNTLAKLERASLDWHKLLTEIYWPKSSKASLYILKDPEVIEELKASIYKNLLRALSCFSDGHSYQSIFDGKSDPRKADNSKVSIRVGKGFIPDILGALKLGIWLEDWCAGLDQTAGNCYDTQSLRWGNRIGYIIMLARSRLKQLMAGSINSVKYILNIQPIGRIK
jgi:hypothetical protein